MRKLSERQKEMYNFILDYIQTYHISPSYDDIMNGMKINNKRSVELDIKRLEDEKLISRQFNSPRSIQLTAQIRGIPIKGTIAAGQLLDIYPDSRVDEWLGIDMVRELGSGNFYALIVRGDSMIGDNISDGDYVIIKEQSTCDDGDIVVAVHKENSQVSSTLKRFARNRKLKKMYLKPSNEKYDVTTIDEDVWEQVWEIQGKVVGVYRRVGETLKSRSRGKPHYPKKNQ